MKLGVIIVLMHSVYAARKAGGTDQRDLATSEAAPQKVMLSTISIQKLLRLLRETTTCDARVQNIQDRCVRARLCLSMRIIKGPRSSQPTKRRRIVSLPIRNPCFSRPSHERAPLPARSADLLFSCVSNELLKQFDLTLADGRVRVKRSFPLGGPQCSRPFRLIAL